MSRIRDFDVSGMSCAGCAMRIENTLKQQNWVAGAVVNFATRTATVDSNEPDNKIIETINSLGYKSTLAEDYFVLQQQEKILQKAAYRRLWTAIVFSLPVFVISMFSLSFPYSNWVQFGLTTVVMVFPGRIFFTNAFNLLKMFDANMDTLVATGSLASYLFSIYMLIAGGHSHLFFESTVVIITFLLIGKYLEEKARHKASQSLRELVTLEPREALLCNNNTSEFTIAQNIKSISSRLLVVGNRVLVSVGGGFPADGVIVVGKSSVNEALLTGESIPREVFVGDNVIAGSINLSGPLEIMVNAVGVSSQLGQIIAAVKKAIGSKAPIQRIADKVSSIFVPIIIVIAIIVFVAWLLIGSSLHVAMLAAVSVLVVACPCALGLATPMSILVATGKAARMGILIKDASSLELLHKANVVVFDKTGTLTMGEPTVCNEQFFPEVIPFYISVLRAIIYEIEKKSHHPYAQALVKYYAIAKHLTPESSFVINSVSEQAGNGITAEVSVLTPTEGMQNFFIEIGKNTDEKYAGFGIKVLVDNVLVALFDLQDSLRKEAKHAIDTLKKLNITPLMATGDTESNAKSIADIVHISFFARQTPFDKEDLIKRLKQEGDRVVMVGDGINDAPALAVADVGIAIGTGTDVAIQTAGLTLLDGGIEKIAQSLAISRATFRNIKQNLFWAFAYNVILIPVAATGHLSPMLAAAAMAFSSIFVVLNALRLRNIKI